MDKTIAVLTFLAQKLAPVNDVIGIQIPNEPWDVNGLTQFMFNKSFLISSSGV